MRFYIFGNVEVETRIINEDHAVRPPCLDIALAHLHVAEYRWQMEQHRNKAHVGEIAIVLYQCTTYRRHQVATKEPEIGLGVNFFQRAHQAGRMEVA